MQRSDIKDGMPVMVNWPQGPEPAIVFWNETLDTFGLRFEPEEGSDEFSEISEAVLAIVEPVTDEAKHEMKHPASLE